MSASNQLSTVPAKSPGALALMGARLNVDSGKLLTTLKNTVFKGASNDELLALVVVANEYGLNPLTKEIYAFPGKGGGIVPVVSIDGWLNIANSHPAMDGFEFEDHHDDMGNLVSCSCKIYRTDRNHPVEVTEYLSECKRNTEPWKMEHRMLRHKAFIQASRYAFGFSGIHDEDEAGKIGEKPVSGIARSVPIDPFDQQPTNDPPPAEKAELQHDAAEADGGGSQPNQNHDEENLI